MNDRQMREHLLAEGARRAEVAPSDEPSDEPSQPERSGELLAPAEVADLFGVNPKTVTRWANDGKLNPVRTLGGHRRYYASEVHRLREGG